MPSEVIVEVRTVTSADLYQADYQFPVPFILELEQGEFFAEQMIRLIPRRRMVIFGTWRGIPAVAKLFFDHKHAKRHLTLEAAGVQIMKDYKIPSPALHYAGPALDQKIQVLVFERILHAGDMESIWMHRESDETVLPVLHAVMVEIATQHVLGVLQRDLHLGNFLFSGKMIYTLDGAQITVMPGLLPKKESMENIALLLSQLGAGVETLQHSLFLHYARARGWLLKPADTTEMLYLIKKYDVERWKRYEKKIYRSSTEFSRIARLGWRGMAARRYAGQELQEFIRHPESVFMHPSAVMLKNGRSSTVIKVNLDGHELVIKRYNMKNIWHRMRRLLRVTRASHSWRLAQKLRLFQVNTAEPVAYLETNMFGLRGKSYYVMSHVSGCDVKKYLTPYENEPYAAANVIQRVCKLLTSLKKLEITHGDLKAANIIVDNHGRPCLIDLDGAREHLSLTGLRADWRKEITRFMRNFNDMPALGNVIRRLLKEA
jgi:tRNA A-37 threonylcarbamoyl transferase component Bud32